MSFGMPAYSTKNVTRERADQNARTLYGYWLAGKNSLKHCPRESLAYGTSASMLQRELKRLKSQLPAFGLSHLRLNVDTLGKLRRLAEQYTPSQIRGIAAQVRQHRSRFGGTHLMRVLAVDDRGRRDALTSRAIQESWSAAELVRTVQAERGQRRPFVGRHPRVPATEDQRLLALDALAEKWCRWCDAALGRLPKVVQARVKKATQAVVEVQAAIAALLHRVRERPNRDPKRT